MTMKVDVYYAEICGLCHKALDFFRAQDVELTTYEVHWDGERFVDSPNAIAMRERCGEVDFVPQIFIGNRHPECHQHSVTLKLVYYAAVTLYGLDYRREVFV